MEINVFSIIAYYCSFLCLAISIVSLWIAPKSNLNRVFSLVSFLIAAWIFLYSFVYFEIEAVSIWFYYNLSSAVCVFISPTLILFLFLLLEMPLKKAIYSSFPFYLFSTFLAFGFFLGHIYAKGFLRTSLGNVQINSSDTPLYWTYNVLLLFYFGMGAVLFFQSRRNPDRRYRAMTNILGVWILAGAVAYLALRLLEFLSDFHFPATGLLVVGLVFSGAALNTILRFQMLDRKNLNIKHTMIQNLTNAVFVFDTQLRIVRWNPHAAFLLNKNLNSQSASLLGVCEETESIERIWKVAKEKNVPQRNSPCSKDGKTQLIDLIPLRDRFDDLIGGLAVFHKAGHFERLAKQFSFTERELTVLIHICSGETNREIAARLDISQETVKTHVKNIFLKTGLNSRIELRLLLE